MAGAANQPPNNNHVNWNAWEQQIGVEARPVPIAERCLTEVDHINDHRLPDGSVPDWVCDEVSKNLLSAVQEAAMPYAITKTRHRREMVDTDEAGRRLRAFTWLGKTAVENAMSGYRYHRHPNALRRVGVEVDEAEQGEEYLRPGMFKLLISPRMTRQEATLKEAEAEHLAHEDAVRATQNFVDANGEVQEREMQSLLVRNIPLAAWVSLCNDPNNIFGKSLQVNDDGRSLSVMEAHREMTIEADKLPEGVLTVVAEAVQYIEDPEVRRDVEQQIERFRESQSDMQAKARSIEKRWLEFELELALSLHEQRATPDIYSFINSMQSYWNEDALEVILKNQLPNGHYRMTRELAAVLETAKQNMLWTRAAVVTDNEKVLEQLDPEVAQAIRRDELFMQIAEANGEHVDLHAMHVLLDQQIAGQNVKVGGGCAGVNEGVFDEGPLGGGNAGEVADPVEAGDNEVMRQMRKKERKKTGKIKKGICIIQTCPTRPAETKVGACRICIDHCQKIFDRGGDPSREGTSQKQENAGTSAVSGNVFAAERSGSKPSAASNAEKPKQKRQGVRRAGNAAVRASSVSNSRSQQRGEALSNNHNHSRRRLGRAGMTGAQNDRRSQHPTQKSSKKKELAAA